MSIFLRWPKCYGQGGWRVEAEEEAWRAVVAEGLQQSALAFESVEEVNHD